MHITYFPSARETEPSPFELDWSGIISIMQTAFAGEWDRARKLDSPAIITGLCEGKRANANIRHLSLFAADFDIPPADDSYLSFDAMCARLDREGLAFVAYTTTANDIDHNRYRVIMPLGKDVPPAQWAGVWQACNTKFDNAVDPITKDPARLSFLPAQWQGNPYYDRGKRKTLNQPFNAFRYSLLGHPILSVREIDAAASPPANTKQTARTRGVNGTAHTTANLTADEASSLSRGNSPDAPCWRLIGSLETSPLITPWMRETLPTEPGSRDHRFCLYAALNAVKHNIPVSADILARLASEWSKVYLFRPAPADIARQAENALAWAIRAPTEQPPETAI